MNFLRHRGVRRLGLVLAFFVTGCTLVGVACEIPTRWGPNFVTVPAFLFSAVLAVVALLTSLALFCLLAEPFVWWLWGEDDRNP